MLLVLIAFILIIVFFVRFYEKNTNVMCTSKRRLDGKTALVTGGTAGMGLHIATDLAGRGARVIVACPFEEEGNQGLKTIKERSGNDNVVFKLLDLSSLNSVRNFAADINEEEERLDILVNNAGVGWPKDFLTRDGLSFIMSVNYFGHFLLTVLLLPLLKKSGSVTEPSRIVNTASVMHYIGIFGFDNLNETNDNFGRVLIYSKSKFAMVLFSLELTNRLVNDNVVANSVDPGAVGTGIFNSAGRVIGPIISFVFRNIYKTPKEGAQTAIHVAVDEGARKISGGFFKNCKETTAVRWAYDDKLIKRLWEESVKSVKLSKEEYKKCLFS